MSFWGVAISAASAVYQGYQANKQANAAKRAGKDPLAKERKEIAGTVMGLLKDPSEFYSSPMYQAAFGQGQQAVARGFAGGGMLGSGNMATGLQQYGQSQGFDMFMEYEKMLAQMAGFGDFQSRSQGFQAQSDANGQMANAFGQLGALAGYYGNRTSTAGTPAAGSYNSPGIYSPTYGQPAQSPMTPGTWDTINAGG